MVRRTIRVRETPGSSPGSPTFRQAQSLRLLRLKKNPELAEGPMFTVYILRGPQNHLYIGCSKNVKMRILRHKSGEGAEFTRRNKVFNLVYKEEYSTLLEARRREKQIKGWNRQKKGVPSPFPLILS